VINFPGKELADYAAVAFDRLKAQQAELLGSDVVSSWPASHAPAKTRAFASPRRWLSRERSR
ncbi:MAG TPA: hypothetical protein VFX03_06050, partial [Thermomicrobiales bacterium]|nr:hypothetical protein [Thermomicrobiales bacterium]